MSKIVLTPQTYLAPDLPATLAHCFDEVYLLRSPGISEEAANGDRKLSDMFITLEPSDNNDDIGLETEILEDLMHRWEVFITRQRRDGALDEIKAGVRPRQPDLETTRTVMRQLMNGAQPEKQLQKPPSASPALLLKLAHLMDQKAAELRSMAKSLDLQQEILSTMLGPNLEDEPPTEFQRVTPSLVGSMGLEVEDESLTSYRLKAWASLAPFQKIKSLTPLTLSPQAAVLLLERANTFLGGKPVRSAAGVQSLLWPPVSLSMAGVTLAREALRLRLPLPDEALEFKKTLNIMLEAIGQSPMSIELMKSLQEMGGSWLEHGGPQKPGGRLGLMVFPGYSMAGLVNLMKGHASKPESPGANCPLWVLW